MGKETVEKVVVDMPIVKQMVAEVVSGVAIPLADVLMVEDAEDLAEDVPKISSFERCSNGYISRGFFIVP